MFGTARSFRTKATPCSRKSAWRKTPEVMAEELRQKAHAQKCAKACAPSGTFLDPCKLDSDGWFRLPPFPRLCGPRDPERMWTTPFYIENYHYEGLPTKYLTGANAPIMVWPAEFETAELWDYERWLRARTLGRWGEVQEDVVDEDVLRDAATAAPQDEEKPKAPAPQPTPQPEEKAKAPAPKSQTPTPHPEEGANAPVSKDADVSQDGASQDDAPQDDIIPTPPPAVLKANTLEQDDNHEAAN